MRTEKPLPAFVAPPVSATDAVAESNHRIANNLTLIAGMVRMHARAITRESGVMPIDQVRSLLEEIGGRIESIAHLHGLLAKAELGEPIDLSAYLREVSRTVVSTLTDGQRAQLTEIPMSACLVAPERALTIGLIIGELVTNAVKYSHPTGVTGKIAVGCRVAGGDIVVEVVDDGVGLPEGFDPEQDGGLGMRLVRSLADQMKAKVRFTDTGTGLLVQVIVPEVYPVLNGGAQSPS